MFLTKEERIYLLRHLQELQADFEELTTEELEECRLCMFNRVSECLAILKESEEDNEY
jgi:hypothetical protein